MGPVVTSLDIRGYQGEPVPNTLYAREAGSSALGILLPGIGYTAQMPLLWYARHLLQERGADVVTVDYAYMTRPDFRSGAPEAEERFHGDVRAALHTALRHGSYTHLALVGKSLGTLAIGYLLAEEMVEPAHIIWLTPLLKREELFRQMCRRQGPSLVIIGRADPEYDADLLRQMREATGSQELVIDDANHSMEIEGDTVRSVREMARIVETMQRFLTG